jgi:hypothetical protein
MTTITADASLQSSPAPLTQVTEIRSADGRLMGTFTPASASSIAAEREALYRYAASLFDPEELRRCKESDEPCYSFQEVMEYLHSWESK